MQRRPAATNNALQATLVNVAKIRVDCSAVLVAKGILVSWSAPELGRLNELSTTPNYVDGELVFTVTHPFHPLSGRQFTLLAQRHTWGEPRVFFHDPATGLIRSLPIVWTDLAPPDPFVLLAAGRAILRLTDLQALMRLLDTSSQEVP